MTTNTETAKTHAKIFIFATITSCSLTGQCTSLPSAVCSPSLLQGPDLVFIFVAPKIYLCEHLHNFHHDHHQLVETAVAAWVNAPPREVQSRPAAMFIIFAPYICHIHLHLYHHHQSAVAAWVNAPPGIPAKCSRGLLQGLDPVHSSL